MKRIKDIRNKKDVQLLVDTFYQAILKDEKIAFFFTEVVKVDFKKHLPLMCDFWDSILFNSEDFSGNPMEKHLEINTISPLHAQHFENWVTLFAATTDKLFRGPNADRVKESASSIATVMQIKMSK